MASFSDGTLNGPFYFAWANSNETTFGAEHIRNDEEVLSFEVSQSEGNYAALDIVIRNPKIGLLSSTRKTWAWLSYNPYWRKNVPYQVGAESVSDEGISGSYATESAQSSQEINFNVNAMVPLFFGRLVGIPDSLTGEVVTLSFLARPYDFSTQKQAAADALKVLPFYDPVFVDVSAVDNPDAVLEGYPRLWHIDRITGAVTSSDVLQGEDGTEAFAAAEVPYESVRISLGQNPLVAVTMDASVKWKQSYSGSVASVGVNTVDTYTGKSLMDSWPKLGADLGGGWYVKASSVEDIYDCNTVKVVSYSYNWQNTRSPLSTGDSLSISYNSSMPEIRGPYKSVDLTSRFQVGVVDPFSDPPLNRPAQIESTTFYLAQSRIKTSLTLGYNAGRDRTERVRFTLAADVQPLVTSPDSADTLRLTLDGRDVGTPMTEVGSSLAGSSVAGLVPIEDRARASYFTTDRGLQSLEYLIAVARAALMIRARAVEIEWECSFERAIQLTLRKNASIVDDRLAGGSAIGKIIEYSFSCDGDTGEMTGRVKIGCAVGRDGTVSVVAGTPDYVDTGYVDVGYQTYTGAYAVAAFGDASVSYSPPDGEPNDDGLTFPLSKSKAITETWYGSLEEQEAIISNIFTSDSRDLTGVESFPATYDTVQDKTTTKDDKVKAALESLATYFELVLIPLDGGPYNTDYDIAVSTLKIPKTIDLET